MILDLLRTNNPFASDSVADPWEDVYPSVPAIHARPFQELGNLISQKANNPTLATGALVFGEPGSGKTHLVKRIVDSVHTARRPLLAAYIQPIEIPQLPYSYLLRQIISNLRRPLIRSHNALTQLDILLSRWILEQVEPQIFAMSPTMATAVKNQPERILNLDLSSLDLDVLDSQNIPKNLRKILPFYCKKTYRQAVTDWLASDALDPEHLEIFKLPDRLAASAEEREAEALELLIAIGEMLSRCHYCLLVCFDRWENLETAAQVRATSRMVGELFDRIKGMLPVVLARSMEWEDRFSKEINNHVVSRLANNKFSLENCNRETAIALIKSRLAFVLKDDANGIDPFTQDQLDSFLGTGSLSPRAVISLANGQLRDILNKEPLSTIPTTAGLLAKEFEDRHQQILADLGHDIPDRGRLKRALYVLLSKLPGVTLKDPDTSAKDKIDLLIATEDSKNRHKDIALIIDLEQHHRAVGAAIERGLHHLNEGPDHQVVYVRDGRHPIPDRPKWPVTNDRKEQLEQHGALLWTLSAEQAAGWYALADLAYAVKAGDITLVHSGKMQILYQDDLLTWAPIGLRDHAAFAPLWLFLEQQGLALSVYQ